MKSQNVSLLCVLCLCCSLISVTSSLKLPKSQATRVFPSSSSSSSPSSSATSSLTSHSSYSSLNRTSKSTRYVDPRVTLGCHRREYTFKAVQTDSMGRSCYQYITTMSCWGRCDSGEVSDAFFLSSIHHSLIHLPCTPLTTHLYYFSLDSLI